MKKSRLSDAEQYELLKQQVVGLPPIRRGSVVRRLMACGKAGCRCQESPPRLHGPYYQWTRKIKGKTVTVRINQAQADLLKMWIENSRRLDRIVRQMEALSTRLTEQALLEADPERANPKRSGRRS